MSSQMLLQKPREEARVGKADLGIRIVSVTSTVNKIFLSRPGGDLRASVAKPFEFDVDLNESARTENSLTVRYSFTFGRPLAGQVCKITGKAVVRFSQFNPAKDFHYLGNDITNEIAVEIFRKNFESVYLLHDAMMMEAPSPWITQGVSLSSHS
jgi:hypothetical protein